MTVRESKRNWWIDLLMLPVGVVTFFPFYLIVVSTIKTQQEAALHPIALPKKFYWDNYANVFKEVNLTQSFGNSLLVTIVSVLLMVLIGVMAAYPIVFNRNRTNKAVTVYLLTGFLIPFQTTLIPLFELMTDMRLVDKLYGLVLLYMGGAVFVFFLARGYMNTIPRELPEAALIDGCSIWAIFWRIILPLLQPITVTAIVFQTMWIWNDFLAPMLFLNSRSNATLVLQIYQSKGEFSVNWPMFMTLTVIVLVPIFIFFVLMQRQIVKGIVGGAVKGIRKETACVAVKA